MPAKANATLQTLQRAIDETRHSNIMLKEAVGLLHASIFGRADPDPARSLPGLQETQERMIAQMGDLRQQITDAKKQLQETTVKVDRLRWWIGGGMAVATFLLSVVDVAVRTGLRYH